MRNPEALRVKGHHRHLRAVRALLILAVLGIVGGLSTPAVPPAFAAPLGVEASCSGQVNLAARLASTGGARQLITVQSRAWASPRATLVFWDRVGGCWHEEGGPWPGFIGENGFSLHHREGDGTTPAGLFPIGPIVYGNAPNPGVTATYHRLVCGDWWDEDPKSAHYNTFQHLPCGQKPSFGGGSEALWTETSAYPSFLVVEYNTRPVVPYAGSAIFVHASTGGPTVGCASLALPALDWLLRHLDWADHPVVAMAPASYIQRL